MDDIKTTPITVRLPLDLQSRLRAIARREHNGVSAVLRRIVSEALQRPSIPDLEAGKDDPREAA